MTFGEFADEVVTLANAWDSGRWERQVAHVLPRYRKNEIVAVLQALRLIGVIGKNIEHPDPPADCDFCELSLETKGCFVDGQVHGGIWANMCVDCFAIEGAGIGWGLGQVYMHIDNRWQCIGGGETEPPGERDA